jgi:hypothetical protein
MAAVINNPLNNSKYKKTMPAVLPDNSVSYIFTKQTIGKKKLMVSFDNVGMCSPYFRCKKAPAAINKKIGNVIWINTVVKTDKVKPPPFTKKRKRSAPLRFPRDVTHFCSRQRMQ